MKIDIIVPEKLSEITLGQYQKYLKIQENETDDRFLATKMLEIFCDVQLKEAIYLKLNDVNSICEILVDMFNEKPDLVKTFKMGKVEYGFIPKLDDMTFGEYVDLDNYLGDWEQMHKAMAVLYRPVKSKYGDRYSIEDYTAEDTDIMKYMPLDAAISSVLFFYRLGIDLSATMMNYLESNQEANLVQYLNSQKNGIGINQFTLSLKEILQDLKISLN